METVMDDLKVALFGHREIDDLLKLDLRLVSEVEKMVLNKSYVNFLIGRNGEFDEYAASVIKRVQKRRGKHNNEITLVLPYVVKDVEYYEKYYDNVFIPESVQGAHPKSAIKRRNRWMVDYADVVIVYVERDHGGAYDAMKYAKKTGKTVINLVENQ